MIRKTITSTLVILLIHTGINAQELENILLAKNDASKLTEAYLSPVIKGLVYSMNAGWYHTAKVHKKFGFDLSISANASFIPSKEEIFDITKIGLSNATTSNINTTASVSGSNSITPATITYNGTVDGQNISTTFTMPEGIKEDLPLNAVPSPTIQIGLGLPYKFDAMLRLVPKVGSSDVKAQLFGIGLKKEITDWFGVIDKTPLHISLLAAYTNMTVDYTITPVNEAVATTNGSTEFKLNSYTIQALASINFPIINFYGALGYNGGSTSLSMLGDYTLTYTPTAQETIKNPFSVKSNTGSFNATIGTRLSLGFFKIFGSYSLQEYNTLNAGIAFSFR